MQWARLKISEYLNNVGKGNIKAAVLLLQRNQKSLLQWAITEISEYEHYLFIVRCLEKYACCDVIFQERTSILNSSEPRI